MYCSGKRIYPAPRRVFGFVITTSSNVAAIFFCISKFLRIKSVLEEAICGKEKSPATKLYTATVLLSGNAGVPSDCGAWGGTGMGLFTNCIPPQQHVTV